MQMLSRLRFAGSGSRRRSGWPCFCWRAAELAKVQPERHRRLRLQPHSRISASDASFAIQQQGEQQGQGITITSVNGFSGTATVSFTLPSGLSVSPLGSLRWPPAKPSLLWSRHPLPRPSEPTPET